MGIIGNGFYQLILVLLGSHSWSSSFSRYIGVQVETEIDNRIIQEEIELASPFDIEGCRLAKKRKITDRFLVSCTEFKQVIIKGPSTKYNVDFGEVCFSISKLPHCRPECKEQRNIKIKSNHRFACISTKADDKNEVAANEIIKKIQNGIFVDLSAWKPLYKLPIKFPTGCS